jgi:hypothetical protein
MGIQGFLEVVPLFFMNFNNYITKIHNTFQFQQGQELAQLLPWKDAEKQIPLNILEEIHDLTDIQHKAQLGTSFSNNDDAIFISLYLKYLVNLNYDSFLQLINHYHSTKKLLESWLMPLTRSLLRGLVYVSIQVIKINIRAIRLRIPKSIECVHKMSLPKCAPCY